MDEVVTLDRRFMFAADLTHRSTARGWRSGYVRTLRTLDKPYQRKVVLEPDYFGFRTASNGLWVGYGLAAPNGLGSNGRGLFMQPLSTRRRRAVRN